MDRHCAFLAMKPHWTITVGIKKIVRKVLHFQWYSIQCFLFTNYTYPVKPYWRVSIIKFYYIIVILSIYGLFNWCHSSNFKIAGITVGITVAVTVTYTCEKFLLFISIFMRSWRSHMFIDYSMMIYNTEGTSTTQKKINYNVLISWNFGPTVLTKFDCCRFQKNRVPW